MTLTSPFHLHPRGHSDAPSVSPAARPPDGSVDEQPGNEAPDPHQGRRPRGRPVRVGTIAFRSASAYLLLWMLVLLGVEVIVFLVGYLLLARLGVLESVSAAAATVLGDPVPESGVLPALELAALLPWAVVAGAALALLWLVMSLALVLVHNAICAITGGPRVHVR